MHPTIEELLAAGPVITDGAWGTQFQQQGLEPGDCPDRWNVNYPERVEAVARSYVEAGSDIILTNTFSANRFALDRYGLAGEVAQLNRSGVEISLRAAAGGRPAHPPKPVRVFGSMGPTGVMLMMGEVREDELRAAFAAQAEALAEAGAAGLVIETMSDPAEARLAVAAAAETGLPVVACMVFGSGKSQDRTMMGTTPEKAAEVLLAAGAAVIGSNCGQGVAGFVPICRRLHAVSGGPVWIKANAGLPEVIDGRPVYRQTAADFAGFAPALVGSGAGFLGGCCGTTPEFIRALRERMKAEG